MPTPASGQDSPEFGGFRLAAGVDIVAIRTRTPEALNDVLAGRVEIAL
jgi:hypothetical protein